MNPVVIVLLLSAVVTSAMSLPLIKGRVKMNPWYGVRIPAAFASDERWFDINRYGGRLLFNWGVMIAAAAAVGALLKQEDWVAYNWTALAVIMGGLAVIVVKILAYARKPERA